MSKMLFTSTGTAVALGREYGRGGEGSVHEVPLRSEQVAKLYHKPPNAKKQDKLRFMAATADAQLLNYVAWPQETLHLSRGGPVVGFLMPKVKEKAPIHMIYSPAHRRQDYPKAGWDFLLYVSRNIAASFETIHAHGHVVGDVNQNSVMVGRDSTVVLIDSDSFQINARGVLHLCHVGVSHFTPPELQSVSSFDAFTRAANHDNFGLALLIFHVLFGGRHPYSGVPLRSGVGDALETDILHFRYAYSRDNGIRGINPPPRSIPVSILPEEVESMFHAAFTERGASGVRPTAQQWVTALDGIRPNLKKCGATGIHVYPKHLTKCPWCALEAKGVAYFVDLGARFTPVANGIVLTQIWAQIQAIPPPPGVSVPCPSGCTVIAQPLPKGVPGKVTIILLRLLALAVAVFFFAVAPGAWIVAILVGGAGWITAGSVGSSQRADESRKRRVALQKAQKDYDQLVERAKMEVGPEGFNARKVEYSKVRDELADLPRVEKQEVDKLHATAYERQKRKFLDTCFIDGASISGVGPARKATLRSFGIETAADVTRDRIMQVRGFGHSLTQAILEWKAGKERWFVFNPAVAVSSADLATVRARHAAKRAELERTLVAAPGQLSLFRQRAIAQLEVLRPHLEAAAQTLAQAQVDLAKLE